MSTLESSRPEAASGAPSIASVIDGEARTDAPGGRLTSTNPAQLDDVVAEVALGRRRHVRRRVRAPPAPPRRSGRRSPRPPAAA